MDPLLNRVALVIIPGVAGVFLLHLAIASMLKRGALRSLLVPVGLVIVALLWLVPTFFELLQPLGTVGGFTLAYGSVCGDE